MQIKDAHNSIRMEIPVNEGSKRVFSLMGDDYVTLKIKVPEPIGFERGDYVDFEDFGRFEIIDLPKPSYDNDTESYDYEIKFEAPYKKWRNKIFRFHPAVGGGEASWSLTDTLAHHLDLILANLKALGIRDEYDNADYVCQIHSDVSKESKFVSYSNTSILDALSKLATEWETEYWVDGNVIHFGKCVNSSLPKITLDILSNVESMGNSASQSDYATRIFAFGSDRNIPKTYRKHLVFTNSAEGSDIYDIQRPLSASYFGTQSPEEYGQPIPNVTIIVIDGETETEITGCIFNPNGEEIVNKPLRLPAGLGLPMGAKYRIPKIEDNAPSSYFSPDVSPLATVDGVASRHLMLPADTPYVDVEENLAKDDIIEKVVVFDWIYPRLNLHVTDVKAIEKSYTDEDGVTKMKVYYRIKDNAFQFDRDWQIEDKEPRIIFESGLLAGMDFEVHYNPDGLPADDPDSRWFEITVNDTYGRELPDSILHPSADTDNTIFDDTLKGDKFVLYNWDSSKYKQVGLIDRAEQELLEETKKYIKEISVDPNTYSCELQSDYAYSEGLDEAGEYHFTFRPGQQVILKNGSFFKTGERESRIMGYECCLDLPYDKPTLTIGDKPTYSRYGELKESLESLSVRIDGVQSEGGSSSIPIIKTGDITPVTDNNVYSALRSDRTHLSKTKNDRTPYNLNVGGKLIPETEIQSKEFMSGLFGWQVNQRGNAEFEGVKVRSFMEIYELITNRQRTIEGDQLYSEGDAIEEVIKHDDGTYTLKLHPEWEGYTTSQIENNVCRGIFNDISSKIPPVPGQTVLHNATYYTSWFRILTVNTAANTVDVVLYPDDEVPAGKNFPPSPMMKFARWGNSGSADDPRYAEKQSVIVISSTEGRIMQLYNVTKPIIDAGNVAFVTGKLPDFITDRDSRLSPGEIGTYIKTVVSENLIEMKHLGRKTPTLIFTGPFDSNAEYLSGDTYDEEEGIYPRHIVEYFGCQWLCSKTGTHEAPSWTSTDWTFYFGDAEFKIELLGVHPIKPAKFTLNLKLLAKKYGQDVTADILAQDVIWTRYSEDKDGNQRIASDNIWATTRGGSGKEITLTTADLDKDADGYPPVCIFRITVTLRDGTQKSKAYGYNNQ